MFLNRYNIDSTTFYDSGFLPENLKVDKKEFNKIWELHPKEYGIVKLYGKEIKTPRWQQTYLKDYRFSGLDHKSMQLPCIVKKYLEWTNTLYQEKSLFNQVLINWYQDGSHYIGSHSDDEHQLLNDSHILSISLGAERKFRIRKDKKIVKDIILKNNNVLVMGGRFQKDYKHEIVKIAGNKGKLVGKRINLTFRKFK